MDSGPDVLADSSSPVELTPSSPYAYTSLSPPPLPFFAGVAYSETVELTPSSPYAYTPSTLHPLPIFAGVVYSGAIGQPSPQFRFPVSICLPSPSILSLASVFLLCSLHPGLLPLPNRLPHSQFRYFKISASSHILHPFTFLQYMDSYIPP